MSEHDDPIYDIRVAIATSLRQFAVTGDHKGITDGAVDLLPDYFRKQHDPARGELIAELREYLKSKHTRLTEYSNESWLPWTPEGLKHVDVELKRLTRLIEFVETL